jgi:hypothetical protein
VKGERGERVKGKKKISRRIIKLIEIGRRRNDRGYAPQIIGANIGVGKRNANKAFQPGERKVME